MGCDDNSNVHVMLCMLYGCGCELCRLFLRQHLLLVFPLTVPMMGFTRMLSGGVRVEREASVLNVMLCNVEKEECDLVIDIVHFAENFTTEYIMPKIMFTFHEMQ